MPEQFARRVVTHGHETPNNPFSLRRVARRHEEKNQLLVERIKQEERPEAQPASKSPASAPAKSIVEIANHCRWFVDATAALLTSSIRNEVSVSVKFLWMPEGGGEPVLHTLLRSTNTRTKRESYAPKDNIRYRDNTAFYELIKNWPKQKSFISDSLFDSWLVGKYNNSNKSWMSFYNSTCVVSIPCSRNDRTLPVGFICADSLLGRLSTRGVESKLEAASWHLYDILGVLCSDQSKVNNDSGDRAQTLHLRCGWREIGDTLVADDFNSQVEFQRILNAVEAVYTEEQGYSPAPPTMAFASPQQEMNVMSDLNEFGDDRDYLAGEGMLPETPVRILPDSEIDKILARMAPRNPDAAAMLRQRQTSNK